MVHDLGAGPDAVAILTMAGDPTSDTVIPDYIAVDHARLLHATVAVAALAIVALDTLGKYTEENRDEIVRRLGTAFA